MYNITREVRDAREVGTNGELMHASDLSSNLLFFQNNEGICIQYYRMIDQKIYIQLYYILHIYERSEQRMVENIRKKI